MPVSVIGAAQECIDFLINRGVIPEGCLHVVIEMKVDEPVKIHYTVVELNESNLEVLLGGTELMVKDG